MQVWTLTTDADEIATQAFATHQQAEDALFDNFDPEGRYGRDIQALLDGEGIVAYIEAHEL